jgi:hypothetical protein
MRLWTLHPRYLDPQGLVTLWREALLARAVLGGRTVGYRHHPQLHRFREHGRPGSAINAYLAAILEEADARGYRFDRKKCGPVRGSIRLRGSIGQLQYEWQHLLRKLRARSPDHHRRCVETGTPEPHPLFIIEDGPIAAWERPQTREGSFSAEAAGVACARPGRAR